MLLTPGAAYDTVIVPEMRVMREAVVARLARFRALGGRVVFLGGVPEWVVRGPAVLSLREAAPDLLDHRSRSTSPGAGHAGCAFGGQPGGRW